MKCDRVRAALSWGPETEAVQAHVATCAECAAFATTLASVRRSAEGAIPPPPDGLADRVLAAVRPGREERPSIVPPVAAMAAAPVAIRWTRRIGTRVAIATGVAAAITAAALTIPGKGTQAPARSTLVAAVERMQAGGAVRFGMIGHFELALAKPIRVPSSFPGLRDALRAGGITLSDDGVDVSRIESSMSGIGEGLLPDRWHMRGIVMPTAADRGVLFRPQRIETISIADRAWIRSDGTRDRWVDVSDAPASINIDPGALLTEAAAAPQRVEDLGIVPAERTYESLWGSITLDDDATFIVPLPGERVRHYRFVRTTDRTGEQVVEVWVGEDERVRFVRISFRNAPNPAGTLRGVVSAAFADATEPVTIEAPKDVITRDQLDDDALGAFGIAMLGGFSISFPVFPSIAPMPYPVPTMPSFPTWTPPSYSPPTYPPPEYWSPGGPGEPWTPPSCCG